MRLVGIAMAAALCAGCSSGAAPDLLAFPQGVPDPADYPDVAEQYRIGSPDHEFYGFTTAEGIRCRVILGDGTGHPIYGTSSAQCVGRLPGNGLDRVSTHGHPDGFDTVAVGLYAHTPGLLGEAGSDLDGPAPGYRRLEPGHRVALCALTHEAKLSCSTVRPGVPGEHVEASSGRTIEVFQKGRPGPAREGFVIGPDKKVFVFDNGKDAG